MESPRKQQVCVCVYALSVGVMFKVFWPTPSVIRPSGWPARWQCPGHDCTEPLFNVLLYKAYTCDAKWLPSVLCFVVWVNHDVVSVTAAMFWSTSDLCCKHKSMREQRTEKRNTEVCAGRIPMWIPIKHVLLNLKRLTRFAGLYTDVEGADILKE